MCVQGTELAPMSTSPERSVAEEYATKRGATLSLLLKVRVTSFMRCGSDIAFLSVHMPRSPDGGVPSPTSYARAPPLNVTRPAPPREQAFPNEQEYLFPPGTYLTPIEGAVPVVEPVALTRQASRGEVLPRSTHVKVVEVEPDFPTM